MTRSASSVCSSLMVHCPAVRAFLDKAPPRDELIQIAIDRIRAFGKYFIELLSIPFRFVGSKFLSLPELVIRVGLFIKTWVTDRANAEWDHIMKDTGYSLVMNPLPEELKLEAQKFARLDASVHTDNPGWIPKNCTHKKRLIDKDLKVVLFHENCADGKGIVHVVFGAKGAEGTKDYDTLNVLKVVWNIFGGISNNYERAEAAYLKLKSENPHLFEGREVICSGLCLGASLAAFVALKQNLKAFCLNAVGLSPNAQSLVGGREGLSKAPRLITLVSADGDFASAPPKIAAIFDFFLNFVGFKTTGNFGTRYVVPAAEEHKVKFSIYKIHRLFIDWCISLDRKHCLILSSLARYINPMVQVRQEDGRVVSGIDYFKKLDNAPPHVLKWLSENNELLAKLAHYLDPTVTVKKENVKKVLLYIESLRNATSEEVRAWLLENGPIPPRLASCLDPTIHSRANGKLVDSIDAFKDGVRLHSVNQWIEQNVAILTHLEHSLNPNNPVNEIDQEKTLKDIETLRRGTSKQLYIWLKQGGFITPRIAPCLDRRIPTKKEVKVAVGNFDAFRPAISPQQCSS